MAKSKPPDTPNSDGPASVALPNLDWMPQDNQPTANYQQRDITHKHLATLPPASADPSKPYTVLARKYRPQTFADLIGQEAMVRTLRNAFATGRIAQGYMLTGVRGVGKTTTARILARALNYSIVGKIDAPTIDMLELGEHCQAIMESRHPDVIEMDAASNTGIDSIREVTESARYRPISARIKVFIIDEVHMLSKGAFNALLKTLEEPPEHVKFIFATTEIRKVPVTVLSRCQRFDLRRVDIPTLSAHFKGIAAKEAMIIADDAVLQIARVAEGSVRDGLSILDQAFASATGPVEAAAVRAMLGLSDRSRIFPLLEAALTGNAKQALLEFGALHHDGADPVQVLADLAETVHIASRIRVGGTDAATDTLSSEDIKSAAAFAERLGLARLSRAWQMLLKGLEEAGRAPDPAAAVDMVLIRMAHMASLPAPDDLVRRLKGALADGAGAVQSGAATQPSGPQGAARPQGQIRMAATSQARPMPAAEPVVPQKPLFTTFPELVAFVGQQRDINLSIDLEDKVRLVRFEPPNIEINLTPDAPPSLPGELASKLGKWTGQRWVVTLSREVGALPLGEVRRQHEAAERENVSTDPLLQRIMKDFPGAEILSVRPLSTDKDGDITP